MRKQFIVVALPSPIWGEKILLKTWGNSELFKTIPIQTKAESIQFYIQFLHIRAIYTNFQSHYFTNYHLWNMATTNQMLPCSMLVRDDNGRRQLENLPMIINRALIANHFTKKRYRYYILHADLLNSKSGLPSLYQPHSNLSLTMNTKNICNF